MEESRDGFAHKNGIRQENERKTIQISRDSKHTKKVGEEWREGEGVRERERERTHRNKERNEGRNGHFREVNKISLNFHLNQSC